MSTLGGRLMLVASLSLLGGCDRETIELSGDAAPDDPAFDAGVDAAPMIPGLIALEVMPEASTVDIDDLAVSRTIELTATGTFEGGERRDVTASVSWGVDNQAPGRLTAPGRWESTNQAGGTVIVEARAGAVSATAEIIVLLRPVVSDSTFPPILDTGDLFDPATPVVQACDGSDRHRDGVVADGCID